MKREILYFQDRFFSTGTTVIYNEHKETAGELDLKSMFTSSVEILDTNGDLQISGKFPMLGLKWRVYDQQGNELGVLRTKVAFFSKKYEYEAYNRGRYTIKSQVFSKHYEIFDDNDIMVGHFDLISGIFSSPAYRLTNDSDGLTAFELIAVIMGVNAIQKRENNTAATLGP